ncbi:MAG: hypothetical protein ABI662_07635, partial [Dermatophilaceae bacterium]
ALDASDAFDRCVQEGIQVKGFRGHCLRLCQTPDAAARWHDLLAAKLEPNVPSSNGPLVDLGIQPVQGGHSGGAGPGGDTGSGRPVNGGSR